MSAVLQVYSKLLLTGCHPPCCYLLRRRAPGEIEDVYVMNTDDVTKRKR